MASPFSGKVVLITGASSGIGAALARELSRRGAKLGLVARRGALLRELAASLPGPSATAAADVSDRHAITAAVAEIRRSLGPIDLAIANAGLSHPTRLHPINHEQIEEVIRVNLLGVIHTLNAVLPEMLERKQGHLAAVSSLAAYKGLPGAAAYCASKAGVNTYLEGLRIQLRPHGVEVTLVCPGFVETPMVSGQKRMPLLLSPDQAARRIAEALARRRKVYNFPWPMMMLMRLAQWVPDRWIAKRLHDSRVE